MEGYKMKSKNVKFEVFDEDKEETTYELTYNKESYLIYVKHDGKFHNKLYECEKEIPEELVWFVDNIIRNELNKNDAIKA